MNKQISLNKSNEEKELKFKNNYIQSNNAKPLYSLFHFFSPLFFLFFFFSFHFCFSKENGHGSKLQTLFNSSPIIL